MTHPNQPEYFTISSVCPHDGATTVIGIFEDMNAVTYRLKRMYTCCGDEYKVECHHLSTAEDEALAYNEQQTNRVKYQKENKVKEELYAKYTKEKEEKE
tara:strand:- start:825 stop:1121 length:297 start_codon:yes stop_codon:yes gene_type:complete